MKNNDKDKKEKVKICPACGKNHQDGDIVSFCPVVFMNVFLAAGK